MAGGDSGGGGGRGGAHQPYGGSYAPSQQLGAVRLAKRPYPPVGGAAAAGGGKKTGEWVDQPMISRHLLFLSLFLPSLCPSLPRSPANRSACHHIQLSLRVRWGLICSALLCPISPLSSAAGWRVFSCFYGRRGEGEEVSEGCGSRRKVYCCFSSSHRTARLMLGPGLQHVRAPACGYAAAALDPFFV